MAEALKEWSRIPYVLVGASGVCVAFAATIAACSNASNVPVVPDSGPVASTDAGMEGSHDGNGMATITDAAPGTFGASCEGGSDCDSGVCFSGGMRSFCSSLCEAGTDCPVPPTLGICNMRGYCKS
jgi:hypothetical protein